MGYEVHERRPMGMRDWQPVAALARVLAAAGVSPNAISVASVIASIAAGAAMASTAVVEGFSARALWLIGGLLVVGRGLCNLLDGMVAVERGVASPTGELYNEVPDRISDTVILIGLGYAATSSPWLGYVAACVALLVAYVRAQARVAGASQHYVGPMAKPQRNALVSLVAVYFAVMPSDWRAGWWGPDHAWGMAQLVLWVIVIGGVWTAARRLYRAGLELKEGTK